MLKNERKSSSLLLEEKKERIKVKNNLK